MDQKQIKELLNGNMVACPKCNEEAVGVEFTDFDLDTGVIEVYLLCDSCYEDWTLIGETTNINWRIEK